MKNCIKKVLFILVIGLTFIVGNSSVKALTCNFKWGSELNDSFDEWAKELVGDYKITKTGSKITASQKFNIKKMFGGHSVDVEFVLSDHLKSSIQNAKKCSELDGQLVYPGTLYNNSKRTLTENGESLDLNLNDKMEVHLIEKNYFCESNVLNSEYEKLLKRASGYYDDYIDEIKKYSYEDYKRLADSMADGGKATNFAQELNNVIFVRIRRELRELPFVLGCNIEDGVSSRFIDDVNELITKKFASAQKTLKQGVNDLIDEGKITQEQANNLLHDVNEALEEAEDTQQEIEKPTITPEKISSLTCEEVIGNEMMDFIKKIFNWIKIIAPIMVIVLSSVDFAGAILKDDKDAVSKATSKLVKRLIIAVALFFVPLIINYLLDIYGQVRGVNITTCM